MTGTMFAGLSQTGAWACLDEFNRIEVEVLSVVASQISEVMQAIKAGLDRFVFMGMTLNTCFTCGRSVGRSVNPSLGQNLKIETKIKAKLSIIQRKI
jgi:dynein heavy chain